MIDFFKINYYFVQQVTVQDIYTVIIYIIFYVK